MKLLTCTVLFAGHPQTDSYGLGSGSPDSLAVYRHTTTRRARIFESENSNLNFVSIKSTLTSKRDHDDHGLTVVLEQSNTCTIHRFRFFLEHQAMYSIAAESEYGKQEEIKNNKYVRGN